MGWIITFVILFLLAILPLGASVLYDAEGPRVRVVAGPLKIQVFPLKRSRRNRSPERPSRRRKPSRKRKKSPPKGRLLRHRRKSRPPNSTTAAPGRISCPWSGWRWTC